MKKILLGSAVVLIGLLISCEKNTIPTEETMAGEIQADETTELPESLPLYAELPPRAGATGQAGETEQAGDTDQAGESDQEGESDQADVAPGSAQYGYKVQMAEYMASGESARLGRIVFFDDRGNKQLDGDFVPELALDGTADISYYVDNSRPSGDLPVAVTEAAIDRAMATWDGIKCSELGITKIPADNSPTGFIASLFGYGGSFDYKADVVHAGWLPREFFDLLDEDGGDYILGVTFTIVFTDPDGNLVDTDNNGKYDVAWREIYYNDEFSWQDGDTFDVETIALHEAGHGLSQAHFGAAFVTGPQNKLHFAPRAVMNAAYSGIQTGISGPDQGGHCGNWSSWPGN